MNITPDDVSNALSTFGQGTPRSMATRWIEQEPAQGPAHLVPIGEFPWGDDFSWLRHLTCGNHPTGKYYTKNPWERGIHLVECPLDVDGNPGMYDCSCNRLSLVVVVAPDSQEQRDIIAKRLADHAQTGCDKDQMIFEGTYGAPGIGQAWRCGYCNKPWSNIGGTFIAEEEGAHLLTIEDVR